VKLVISRHGQASFNADSDKERPLTQAGVEQTKQLMTKHLADLADVDAIWSSDLKRAKQTASIYAQQLSLDIQEKNFLTPDDEPKMVLKHLLDQGADSTLLIVSHQPLVGELVSLLCDGNIYNAHPYTTSEVVVIECDIAEAGLGTKVANYLPY